MNYKNIAIENYLAQQARWPQGGRHILAQYDAQSVIVYQAYRPAIGNFAAEHGYFGGEFSLNRMSWIKPNFLWMMYRSDWARSPGQEVVLAIRLERSFFDELLKQMVPSSFNEAQYNSHDEWKRAVEFSEVRLQWDPDHDPEGNKCERRAIQLGLRGRVLQTYSCDAILEIIDMTDFIAQQRGHAIEPYTELSTPQEFVYPLD
jgi:hypothetical protein